MTWLLLQKLTVVYIIGFLILQRRQWWFIMYLWGAFGLAFLIVELSVLQNWHILLENVEAQHVQSIMGMFGTPIEVINGQTLMVPDSTGWSGLSVGAECSTLLEIAVFSGLLLFYPQLPNRKRWLYFALGVLMIYLLNLARILLIVLMVLQWGKEIVPFAHVVVARVFYFSGMVVLYWFLLTRPMLKLVRQSVAMREQRVRQDGARS